MQQCKDEIKIQVEHSVHARQLVLLQSNESAATADSAHSTDSHSIDSYFILRTRPPPSLVDEAKRRWSRFSVKMRAARVRRAFVVFSLVLRLRGCD